MLGDTNDPCATPHKKATMQPSRVLWIVLAGCAAVTLVYYTLFRAPGKKRTLPTTDPQLKSASTAKSVVPDFSKHPMPLLTLCTTFINAKHRINIQRNVIRNWAQYMPYIQPVLYATFNGSLINLALANGWLVFPVPKVNEHGTPFFKDIMLDIPKRVNSDFYAFCNGDILFSRGLLATVISIHQNLSHSHATLTVGKRTNLKVDPDDAKPFYKPYEIETRAKFGKLYSSDAEDYFIMSNISRFPWAEIKDVVIGRPGYDNYFVAVTAKSGITVIDASNTILALHQTGSDGNKAGFNKTHYQYNLDIIEKFFPFHLGFTDNAKYKTSLNLQDYTVILSRNQAVSTTGLSHWCSMFQTVIIVILLNTKH